MNADWRLTEQLLMERDALIAALERLVIKAELMAGAGAPPDCLEAIAGARAILRQIPRTTE